MLHADNWEQAIRLCGEQLVKSGNVGPKFTEACLAREVDYPTGLPSEIPVAIPHGSSDDILENTVCFLRTDKPVRFTRMDDDEEYCDTQLIFNIAVKPGEDHLNFLQQLMGMVMDTMMLAAAGDLQVIVTQQMLDAYRAYIRANEENVYLKSVDDIVLYKVIIRGQHYMVPVSILLVCPEGIHFTESDQMVYLLFCFVSTGEQDDLEMLKAIIRLGQTPGEARRIAALRDPDTVYASILASTLCKNPHSGDNCRDAGFCVGFYTAFCMTLCDFV